MTNLHDMNRYPSLIGRHVVITGGANGIGAEMVRAFSEQGAIVSFLDTDSTNAHSLIASCASSSSPNVPRFYECDLADFFQLEHTFRDLQAIDVLINNAACDDRHEVDELTVREWDQSMNVNLRHYFFASQLVARTMIDRKCGVILNLGSVTFLNGNPDLPLYVCAKGGILGLTRSLARKWGVHGIRVNCISPGWVRTPRQVEKWLTPEADQRRMDSQCIKDWVLPQDVASMALFLASDDARMCTGQNFVVDGGRASI